MLLKSLRTSAGQLPHDRPYRFENPIAAESRSRFQAVDRPSYRDMLFAFLCTFIGAVSVHDAYLLLHNRQDILEYEQNPIGRWLIEVGGGDVILFVAVKLTTTAVVCSLLLRMYQRRPQQTYSIAVGVAVFQLGLLLYLMGAWR